MGDDRSARNGQQLLDEEALAAKRARTSLDLTATLENPSLLRSPYADTVGSSVSDRDHKSDSNGLPKQSPPPVKKEDSQVQSS